jgi:hypothetical protein
MPWFVIFGGIEHLRKLRTKAIAKLCPETTKNETSGATSMVMEGFSMKPRDRSVAEPVILAYRCFFLCGWSQP